MNLSSSRLTGFDRQVYQLLAQGMHPLRLKVEARELERLSRAFCRERAGVTAPSSDAGQAFELASFLLQEAERVRGALARLRQGREDFLRRFNLARSEEERRRHILDFARELGADAAGLRGDARAFRRWFGQEAVTERFTRRYAQAERRLVLTLDRLGEMAALAFSRAGGNDGALALWRRLGWEKPLKNLLTHSGDSRVCLAAFRCLGRGLRQLPAERREASVDEETLRYVYRCALEPRQPTWIQCEALGLLADLSADSFRTALTRRFEQPRTGDDLFVRRWAVRLLGERGEADPAFRALFTRAAADPSPYVRQALPAALKGQEAAWAAEQLNHLGCGDDSPQVRAATLLAGEALSVRPDLVPALIALLERTLETEKDPFVLRVACRQAAQVHRLLVEAERGPEALAWREALLPRLALLHRGAAHLPARRWAAQAREIIWCGADERARKLLPVVQAEVAKLRPGASRILRAPQLRQADPDLLGRVLAVASQNDFGLDLMSTALGRRLSRGGRFRFRLWRLLHELRHPSSDKRQAFRHTLGRVARADQRAPSAILAELAETKVPGEPLYLEEEGGWRPYLPLVDDVLSVLDQGVLGRPVRFFSAEGVTEVRPPRAPWRRLRARLALTRRFARYARLRNWSEGGQKSPDAYLLALRRLGVEVRFIPHGSGLDQPAAADPAVARFFPLLAPLLPGELWSRLQNYFFSLYENTLYDLGLFTLGGVTLFFGGHALRFHHFRGQRRRLPLVVGGWGTRGKSGTERLKAALFNALGYAVVSKTTGCEAMFLHGNAFGALREMPLFRPYDKATIWEQQAVVALAGRLGADVFLYECMALNPSFVGILRRWMKDDLSTLTNAYPDHEDLQGPAGINIPEVMAEFIPEQGVLCTSEEQMLPVLAAAARQRETRLETVGWLESGLLTPDVLARFPYAEHPNNIALVLAVAADFGLPEEFALKEMADRVIPDLGVLKSYPPAPLRSRRLEFVNGMSANERFACLENWRRMGFDRHDRDAEPEVWLTTVVNNRADRVARSQVFARILVEDVSADRHVLIGTNLAGLHGFVESALEEFTARLTLWPQRGRDEDPAGVAALQAHARRLRVPVADEQVRDRLAAMLAGQPEELPVDDLAALWSDPAALAGHLAQAGLAERGEEVVAFLRRELEQLGQYRELAGRIAGEEGGRERLESDFRELFRAWFREKIVVVEDSHASGEAIVARLCRETPPGLRSRIMGMQNIKGTGLDFVYRWQAWESCHQACRKLESRDPAEAEAGLRALAAFQDFGLLSEETVRATVARVRQAMVAQNELFQAELQVIEANLDTVMARVRSHLGGDRLGGWQARLAAAIEAFLDAGEAVRRRRLANRIYRDLAAERIGHARAASELNLLVQGQKGGWLKARLQNLQRALEGARRPQGAK